MLEMRIAMLEQAILKCADELWQDKQDRLKHPHLPWHGSRSRMPAGEKILKDEENVFYAALVESLRRLEARWPPDELSTLAADMFFNPVLWVPDYGWREHQSGEWWQQVVIYCILDTLIHTMPPPDLVQRLEARIVEILKHPYQGCETNRHYFPPSNHYSPDLDNCMRLLLKPPFSPESLDLMERIMLGDFNFKVASSHAEDAPRMPTYGYYRDLLCIPALMYHLFQAGRLDYETFAQVSLRTVEKLTLTLTKRALMSYVAVEDLLGTEAPDPAFLDTIDEYVARLADQTAESVSEENYHLLKEMQHLRGSHWLLKAAEIHRDFKLQRLVVQEKEYTESTSYKYRTGIDTLVIHLAGVPDIEPESEEERRALVEQLRGFPTKTLEYLLPVSPHGQGVLLEALGWERAAPLITTLLEVARREFTRTSSYTPYGDIPNDIDPASGVLDVAQVRQVIEETGDDLAQEILTLFERAKLGANNTSMLFKAVMGWNQEEIKKRFPKRKQCVVKAFGLLPLKRGAEEALERYLALKEFEKGSKKYGPKRQATELAAAQAALTNLAQVAGYADALRLEWAMEARLSTEVLPVGRICEVDDYQAELTLEGGDARLVISRGDKVLKSVPKAIRQSEDYPTMKEAVAGLRAQARRFKTVFEDFMAAGTPLSRNDLVNLVRMPVAGFLLGQLILQTDDGTLGLFMPDEIAVQPLEGERHSVSESVIIAHPYHLYQAGQLAGWQREIVHRRIVQPFKQAFRELYLLTPAERETHTYSNRFAEHTVSGKVAVRLFQARGWLIESGVPHKVFLEHGFDVCFQFPDAEHYLGLTPFVTSGEIGFQVYPFRREDYYGDDRRQAYIPLADIPPLVFSEVMRDADLVVSVAQCDGHTIMSSEAFTRRAEVVTTLLEDLGLPGVSADGHFAHVKGRLASYKVHLGSAVIHIEPGNYLCIVPERWGQSHEDLFLPFANEGDSKMSEVVSKILLLLRDDKIKDETILRQIKRHSQ